MSTSGIPLDDTKSMIQAINTCQVCGDDATIINYGALSCLSCRTFFRRNASHKKAILPCGLDGHCTMTKLTRKHCTSCRLAKCLTVGMSADLIRKEELTGKKRKAYRQETIENKAMMTIPQASALDYPSDDSRSSLSTSDWTVISNVVHAFDAFSPVTEIRRTIETINKSTSTSRFDLPRTLQMILSFSNCLQLFVSSTPDFKVLTTCEQWSLLQRNTFGLLSIGGVYLMRESGIFDTPENEMTVVSLYGNAAVQQTKLISKQLDCDSTLIKLMLMALAFSSNSFTKESRGNFDKDCLLLGTFRLFGSQNVYVELLWKYLRYRCNYDESVQRFFKLIQRLLDALKLSIEIYENNPTYQLFIDKINDEVEKSTIINENSIIPLWGKDLSFHGPII